MQKSSKKIYIYALITILILFLVSSQFAFVVTYFEQLHKLEIIDYPRMPLSTLTDDRYGLFLQTGLTEKAIKTIAPEKLNDTINDYQKDLFENKSFACHRVSPFTHEEILDNPHLPFIDLQNGDIIVTVNAHSLGYIHGHAALIVNNKWSQILEAQTYGYSSHITSINAFYYNPSIVQLRLMDDNFPHDELANYAKRNLVNIRYSLLATSANFHKSTIPSSSQCAHLIWTAYKQFDVDIDNDGGLFISVNDILASSKLEVVQVLGINPLQLLRFRNK